MNNISKKVREIGPKTGLMIDYISPVPSRCMTNLLCHETQWPTLYKSYCYDYDTLIIYMLKIRSR